ncbi:MAG: UPF0149 family protein [Gammaproteobacteria bacterium]|nr:UPF0149 family protein [Gammaproteobacteria bacterium]
METSVSDPLPEYAQVAEALRRSGMPQCPAELHGFALGMIVAGVPEPLRVWQQEVYAEFDPNDVLDNESRALLERVFAAALSAGSSEAEGLHLLLPTALAVDAARLRALRDWCQGFVFGVGLAGETLDARLTSASRELLNDIAEITRLETDDVDDSRENQAALIEIEEYVREGVMLMRLDLAGAPAAN